MDKKNLAILITAAVLIFLVGGGMGILFTGNSKKVKDAVASLSSKVVVDAVTYGQVTDINGKNITLSFGGDNLTIKIIDNAMIYSFATQASTQTGAAPSPIQQKTDFSEIKKGDYLNIHMKLLPDATLEGQSVFILPAFGQTNASNQ